MSLRRSKEGFIGSEGLFGLDSLEQCEVSTSVHAKRQAAAFYTCCSLKAGDSGSHRKVGYCVLMGEGWGFQ